MIFKEAYPPYLPFFFLEVTFRKGVPLSVAASFFFFFVSALEIGLEAVPLICS
jgi:hypothetical protein